MNRQQRREAERRAESFHERNSFSRDEVEQLNITSYDMGAAHAVEAVAIVFGLGPKRLQLVKEKMLMLQQLDFQFLPKQQGTKMNIHQVRLNREQRRAQEPTRKGRVTE